MSSVAGPRPLTAFDVQFLAGEAGNMLSHYIGLWIAGPDARGESLTAARVEALVASRIDRIPALRWRLQSVPLGLDYPSFVDGEVDLSQHIFAGTVPAPGGHRELAAATAALMAVKLDRRRPLWEFHVLDGLEDGRVAVAMKFHHASADAMAAATMMSLLLDADPLARDDLPAPVGAGTPVSVRERVLGAATSLPMQPLRAVRAGLKAIPHLDQVPMLRTVPGVRVLAQSARRTQRALGQGSQTPVTFHHAPRMRFNQALSAERTIAFGTVDVNDVRRLKSAHGVTFNDIVVAAVAGGLRRRLLELDELPGEPLVAFVPTNTRSPAGVGQIENAISSFIVPIPTHVADAHGRMTEARDAMNVAKARHATAPTTLLENANAMLFPAVFAAIAPGMLRLMGSGLLAPPINLTVSNVPGPPILLHLDGAPLEQVAPLSLVFEGVGLNVTVVSYAGRLEIGLVGDAESVPDAWEFVAGIEAEFAEMLAALRPVSGR